MGGKAWICGTGQTKNYAGNNRPTLGIGVCGRMQESEYWGHYPIADVEYKTDAPVQLGVRSWSPFIPGDSKASNTPGAVFEVHLRNKGTSGAERERGIQLSGLCRASLTRLLDRLAQLAPKAGHASTADLPSSCARRVKGCVGGGQGLGNELRPGDGDDGDVRSGGAWA